MKPYIFYFSFYFNLKKQKKLWNCILWQSPMLLRKHMTVASMFWINKNTEIKLWTLAKIYPWNNSLNHCKQFRRNISKLLKVSLNKGTIANNIEKNKRGKKQKNRKALLCKDASLNNFPEFFDRRIDVISLQI